MNDPENETLNPAATRLYLCGTLGVVLLPLLFIHLQYDQWNPFQLKGKHFLCFYALLLLLCHLIRYAERLFVTSANRQGLWLRSLSILILVVGVARLIQGAYHAKPVGYLALLMALHLILMLLLSSSRKQQP